MVYNVKGYKANILQTPIFKQHTMDNILRFLPGISVRSDGITAYGQGIAAAYVNGRKARLSGPDLVGYLSTFEGKNIVSVEVLDSTAEPDGMPGGGSVLKITTIHDTDGGSCTIGLSGGAGPIEVPHAGGSVNLIAKSGRWNMYAVSKVDPYSKRTPESKSGTDYLNTGESRLESSSSYFKMKPMLSQVVG